MTKPVSRLGCSAQVRGPKRKEFSMRPMQRHAAPSICAVLLLVLMATTSGAPLAQEGSADLPRNAHAKRYGGGWECDYGYQAVDDACGAVSMPANGYLVDSEYGSGWKCDRGYRAVEAACVAVRLPANG